MDKAIIQFGLFAFSAAAIWFVGRKEKWSRWGHICGLASQPFWIYTTIQAEQWGMLALSLFYAYCWGTGVYNYWIKNGTTNTQIPEERV